MRARFGPRGVQDARVALRLGHTRKPGIDRFLSTE